MYVVIDNLFKEKNQTQDKVPSLEDSWNVMLSNWLEFSDKYFKHPHKNFTSLKKKKKSVNKNAIIVKEGILNLCVSAGLWI